MITHLDAHNSKAPSLSKLPHLITPSPSGSKEGNSAAWVSSVEWSTVSSLKKSVNYCISCSNNSCWNILTFRLSDFLHIRGHLFHQWWQSHQTVPLLDLCNPSCPLLILQKVLRNNRAVREEAKFCKITTENSTLFVCFPFVFRILFKFLIVLFHKVADLALIFCAIVRINNWDERFASYIQ